VWRRAGGLITLIQTLAYVFKCVHQDFLQEINLLHAKPIVVRIPMPSRTPEYVLLSALSCTIYLNMMKIGFASLSAQLLIMLIKI
jgi:hypothetical protein